MKKSLFFLIISISTFCFGVLTAPIYYKQVSLEEITQNSKYYDGKTVEIITYARLSDLNDKSILIGEPYEKAESLTFLDLEENSVKYTALHKQLSDNFSMNQYKRIKVKVTGKVRDNCNDGIPCCFGKTLSIYTKDIQTIGQIEYYTVPLAFQFNKSESNSE